MSLFGRDRLQPDQNPSLRPIERGFMEAIGHGSLLDDAAQDNERSWEALSESESVEIGKQLLGEVRLNSPSGPDPGRADWYRETLLTSTDRIEQRLLQRHGVPMQSVAGIRKTVSGIGQEKTALENWRERLDQTVLQANRDAWSQAQIKSDLIQRHAPAALPGSFSPGLSFDGHLARFTDLIQGTQSDIYLGMWAAEHPTLAAGLLQAQDRGVQVGLRTNTPINDLGKAFGQSVWSQLNDYTVAPENVSDHFKFGMAGMGSADTARAIITAANATVAAMGGLEKLTNRPLDGKNVESTLLLSKEAFASGDVWASMYQQLKAAKDWVSSGSEDVVETLLRDQRVTSMFDTSTADGLREAVRYIHENFRGELANVFVQGKATGKSRVLSGGGIAAAHKSLLKQMGAGSRAILVSYNFGDEIAGEIQKAVLRGADITVLHGSRWNMDDVATTHDTKVSRTLQELEANVAGRLDANGGRLRVVQNVSTLVHAKVSVFETGTRPGMQLTGTLNLGDDDMAGRVLSDLIAKGGKAPKAGTPDEAMQSRNLGVLLSQDEYVAYERDRTLLERIVEVSDLTRSNPVGTQPLADEVRGELSKLMVSYGLKPDSATVLGVGKDGPGTGVQFRIGGSFRLGEGAGASWVELGQLMEMTAYRPDEAFVQKGFGRSTSEYFVPKLSKFIGAVRGVGWATEEEPLPGQSRTASGLEVLAAGTVAANREVQGYLDALVEMVGVGRAQEILKNPYEVGRLRTTIRQFTKERYKNFSSFEPGTPVYAAKELAQLLMRVNQQGLLDLNSSLNISSDTLDKILGGNLTRADLGQRNYLFTASGLSRMNRYGEAKTARMYDVEMVNTLPEGDYDAQKDDFTFLMSIGKIAQLPQRLQNIVSTRYLSPTVDREVLQVLGADDPTQTGLVGKSRFVSNRTEAKNRQNMVRFRGYAIPGFSGDQNAYLMGDAFKDLYLGNESFRKTVKITSSTAINTDVGRLLHEQLAGLADTADSGVQRLSGDRYFLNAQALDALEAKLDLAGHRIGDTGMHMLQQLDLGLEGKEVAGVLLDLSRKGSGLRQTGGEWEFTLTGVPMERVTSGGRNLLGAKVPFVLAQVESRLFQGIDRLAQAMYGQKDDPTGVYDKVGMGEFNIVFGMGTIKTGKAFVETGIEMLETGAYKAQLDYLRDATGKGLDPMRGMNKIINRIASGIEDKTIRGELEQVAKLLGDKGPLDDGAFDALERTLEKTAHYLNASEDNVVSLGRFGRRQHAAASLLAFGVHAAYSLTRLDALSQTAEGQGLLTASQMGEFVPRPGQVVSRDMLPTEQVMGLIYLSFTGGVSALATPMSSRNRANLLAYHRSGGTEAIYNMMAQSEAMRGRLAAFDQLTAHGLLGAAGDVRYGMDHVAFRDYVPGLMVEHRGQQVDPYVALQQLQTQMETLRTSDTSGMSFKEHAQAVTAIHGEITDVRARMQQAMEALRGDEAALSADRKWAYKSVGSAQSSLTTRTLTAEIEAGLRTQTLLIPSIDPRNRGGQQGYTPVQFLAREALLSMGAFDNFAHDVIELQAKAGRLLGSLGAIRREGQVLFSDMTAQQSDTYDELMYTIAELQNAQKLVLTSGLQKLMGGMLALPGSNMIIGTMPEIELGTMVVSERAYQKMRGEAIAESMTALKVGIGQLREQAAAQGGSLSERDAAGQVLERMMGRLNAELGGNATGLINAVRAEFDQVFLEEDAYNAQIDNLSLLHDEVHAKYNELKDFLFEQDTGHLAQLRQRRKELEGKARRTAERRTGFQAKRQTLLDSAHSAARGRQQQRLQGINRAYASDMARADVTEQALTRQLIDPLQGQLDTAQAGIDRQVVTQRARVERLQSVSRSQSRLMALQGRLTSRLDSLDAQHGRNSQLYQERNRLLAQTDPANNFDLMRHRATLRPGESLAAAHEKLMETNPAYGRAVFNKRAQALAQVQASPELADVESRIADHELRRQQLAEPVLAMKDRTRRTLKLTTRRRQNLLAEQRAGAANLRVARSGQATLESRLAPQIQGGRRVIDTVVGGMRRTAETRLGQARAAADQAYADDRAFTVAQTEQVIRAMREAEVFPLADELLAGRAALDLPEDASVTQQVRLQMGKPLALDAGSMFTAQDQAEYQALQAEEESWRQGLSALRDERNRLTEERRQLIADRNATERPGVRGALENALGNLVDSNESIRALMMRGGMQRAGAPAGPDALLINRIVRQSEYNARNPAILLDEHLSTRGVFFNIGAMGFFLGDFDGDTGSIFNLADYTRLRTMKLAGIEMTPDEQRTYSRVEQRMNITAAEHVWEFARHYTGLSDRFSSDGFYQGLPGSQGSLEANRAHYAGLLQEAEGAALNLLDPTDSTGQRRFGSLQAARMVYRDPSDLGKVLFGAGTEKALQFTAFTDRQARATQVAESMNQYVLEMGESHTRLLTHMMDPANADKDMRVAYREFFGRKENQKHFAAAVDEFNKKLGKAMGNVTESTDNKRLSYNVMIGYFIQTHFASSQVIAKTFEFVYKMQLESDAQYAQDLTRGMENAQANELRSMRQGTMLVLQQMAREAIKPKEAKKGEGGDTSRVSELDALRQDLDGAADNEVAVKSIDRIFDRPRMKGLNWLSVLSTGKTMLNEKVDVDALRWRDPLVGASPEAEARLAPDGTGKRPWYERLFSGLVNTVVQNTDVPRDMTWDAVQDEVKTAFLDYHEKPILEAFRSGAAYALHTPEQLAAMSEAERRVAGVAADPNAPERAFTLSLEAREEEGRRYLDTIATRQASQAIEMALSARGVNELMSTYRNALTAETRNESGGLMSTLGLQERALGFYALAARGKFVDADAVEMGIKNLFDSVDHLTLTGADGTVDTSAAERRLQQVGFEVTGADDYGNRLASIYRIVRTSGTDLNTAMARSKTDERSVDGRALAEARDFSLRALENIGEGTVAELSELDNMQLSRRLELRADDLESHLKTSGQTDSLETMGRAMNTIGLAGVYDNYQQSRAAQQAQQAVHGQQRVIEQVVNTAARSPGFNNAVFGLGLGTLAGTAAMLATASPAQAQAMNAGGEGSFGETFGTMLGMSVAFARPVNIYRQLAASNRDVDERIAEATVISSAMAGGIAGANLAANKLGEAVHSFYKPADTAAMTFHIQESLNTKTRIAGQFGGAIGGAVGGTVAGLLAQGLLQRAGLLREVNPMEEMVLGLSGFVADGAEEMFAAADDFITDGSEGMGISGMVEMVDEAGEYIDQTVFRMSWASFDDDHGYEDFSGMLQGDTDTFLANVSYEAMTTESDLTLDSSVIGEAAPAG